MKYKAELIVNNKVEDYILLDATMPQEVIRKLKRTNFSTIIIINEEGKYWIYNNYYNKYYLEKKGYLPLSKHELISLFSNNKKLWGNIK